MGLTVLRYRETPVAPGAIVQVASPEAAVSLLRDWQQQFPRDRGMVLDDRERPIATSRPHPKGPI
ncbi:MAG: hypothetical protein ACYDCQ_13395 [Dehalococcoidia bacterium]